MSIPTATSCPVSQNGKPANLRDQAHLSGFVTAVNGTGSAATVTILLSDGVTSVTVQAQYISTSQSL
jgi:hypothetical protein